MKRFILIFTLLLWSLPALAMHDSFSPPVVGQERQGKILVCKNLRQILEFKNVVAYDLRYKYQEDCFWLSQNYMVVNVIEKIDVTYNLIMWKDFDKTVIQLVDHSGHLWYGVIVSIK